MTNIPQLIARLRAEAVTAGEYEDEFFGRALANSSKSLVALFTEAADALESALPCIHAWRNPDALRTQIVRLTQNPYSPTDSQDSPMEPLT